LVRILKTSVVVVRKNRTVVLSGDDVYSEVHYEMISDIRKVVLTYLLENGEGTPYNISRKLHILDATISKALRGLKQIGLINVWKMRSGKRESKHRVEVYKLSNMGLKGLVNSLYYGSEKDEDCVGYLTDIFKKIRLHYPEFLPEIFRKLPFEYSVAFYPFFDSIPITTFLKLILAYTQGKSEVLIENEHLKILVSLTENEARILLNYTEKKIEDKEIKINQVHKELKREKALFESIKQIFQN